VRGTGAALDEAGIADLKKPGTAPPTTYRSVTPKLFEREADRNRGFLDNSSIASFEGPRAA